MPLWQQFDSENVVKVFRRLRKSVKLIRVWRQPLQISTSVTWLGDLLHSGQHFKAGGNNYFPQIAHIFRENFVKLWKYFIFLIKSFLGNFYRHLGTFYWSHWQGQISSRFNCTCIIHEFWLKTRNHSSVLICNIILSTTKKSTAAQISQK